MLRRTTLSIIGAPFFSFKAFLVRRTSRLRAPGSIN